MDEQGTKTRDETMAENQGKDRHGLVGKTLDGRVAIEGVIGEGGMGIVYLGHQTTVDRKVAIKVLLPERTDEETVQRFQNEAKAASQLSHPNTITIHDFGAWGELLYIVMEFLEGQALQDVLDREKRLDPIRVLKITTQVLASLQEAHQLGIIHRDIKPDNVFLKTVGGQPDFVKVLDFGVAKLGEQLRGGDATLTKAGMIFGTPKYMSPEQATARKLDARSDLYTIGVMMFEMLTGTAPFQASDPVSILIQHVHDDPPTFAETAPDLHLPPELEQVVLKLMQKKPDDRFGSARELRELLEHMMLVMQASISTVQGMAIPGPQTGSLLPQPGSGPTPPFHPGSGPAPAMPPPTAPPGSQTGPSAAPNTGQWSDSLGLGGAQAGPVGGLGAPVTEGGVAVAPSGGRGLLIVVIIVGVLLLGAVGYLVVNSVGGGGGDRSDSGIVGAPDVGEMPDALVVVPDAQSTPDVVAMVDVGAPIEDAAALGDAVVEIETPDAEIESPDAEASAPDVATLEDAVALLDDPPLADEDGAAEDAAEDVVAAVDESAEADPVRVRFDLQPSGARVSFRGVEYRREGGEYIFDRATGTRVRGTASADHYRDARVNIDLSDADTSGELRVRVRLELDPCDPANGPVDPYVCN